MDYSKPKYQDLWAFIAFYVHVVVVIAAAGYFWTVVGDEDFDSDTDTDTDTDTDSDTTTFSSEDIEITGIIVALLCSLVAGGLFGLFWLQCIRMMPEMIIKVMLGVQIAACLLIAVIGFATDATILVILGLLFAAFFCLYTWWSVHIFPVYHMYSVYPCTLSVHICRCLLWIFPCFNM